MEGTSAGLAGTGLEVPVGTSPIAPGVCNVERQLLIERVCHPTKDAECSHWEGSVSGIQNPLTMPKTAAQAEGFQAAWISPAADGVRQWRHFRRCEVGT